jgi:hypothetical protein
MLIIFPPAVAAIALQQGEHMGNINNQSAINY